MYAYALTVVFIRVYNKLYDAPAIWRRTSSNKRIARKLANHVDVGHGDVLFTLLFY